MTGNPPTDTTSERRSTPGLGAVLLVLLAAVLLSAAVVWLGPVDAGQGTVTDDVSERTTPAQAGFQTSGEETSNPAGGADDAGRVQNPPEIAPPASAESSDRSGKSPVERHENELVVTTLVLNSLLGLLVFAHRFAPSVIVQYIRPDSRRDDEPGLSEPDDSPDELLDDDDVVTRLLTDNDGRLRQSEIVASTDWSKAKVSRLLGEMESDGDIVKIRLGRQNLICLEGHEPELSKPMPPPPEGARTKPRPDDTRDE